MLLEALPAAPPELTDTDELERAARSTAAHRRDGAHDSGIGRPLLHLDEIQIGTTRLFVLHGAFKRLTPQ